MEDEKKSKKNNTIIKELLSWAILIATTVTATLIFLHFFPASVVIGDSMYNTLTDGQMVLLANKKNPNYSDIVVIRIDESSEYIIKRVIAKEDDHIRITNGKVFLNDKELEEPYLHNLNWGDNFAPEYGDLTVPPNMIYVMGDNRDNSMDSRDLGPLPIENIKGVLIIKFPFSRKAILIILLVICISLGIFTYHREKYHSDKSETENRKEEL